MVFAHILVYAVFVTALVYIIFWWWRRNNQWKGVKNVPGPIAFPIIGNTHLLLGCNLSEAFQRVRDIRKAYGNTTKFWFGNHLLITVSDPVAIERTIGNKLIQERSELTKILSKELFRNGLLLNNGETWRLHRKILSTLFHNNVLDKFVENFSKNATILADRLSEIEKETVFNTYEFAILCTTDIICETVLGAKINAQKERQLMFAKYVTDFLHIVGEKARRPWLFLEVFFRFTELSGKLDNVVNFFYSNVKDMLTTQGEKYIHGTSLPETVKTKTLLDLFVENGEVTDQEIVEEAVTMLTTGSETTATMFSFSLVALAEYQDVQAKVVEEQRCVFGNDFQRPVTGEDLHQMPYLEQVIKEVLRLYPPVTFLFRLISEDTDLGNGYWAPKGSNVTVITCDTHRDPNLYPDPERFDPERFSPENCYGRHPYAYIPFGAGRRICIGYKYAMMELKAMLSVVLRRYKLVRAIDGLKEIEKNLEFGLVIRSSIGYKIHIEPRQS